MLLDYILLLNFKQIKAERSEAAIFNILKAKKSIQTVQDIHIFGLEKFYGTGKFLNKKLFEDRINQLKKNGQLNIIAGKNNYTVSEKGLDWLEKNQYNIPLNYFNGHKYERISADFYKRLILLIQTLTNSKMNHYSFIPVIDHRATEDWVKSFYLKTRNNKIEVLTMLYKELSQLLSVCSTKESEIFVDRLSGYKKYGLSINQLALQHNMDNEDISLLLTGIIHHILAIVKKQKQNFPLLTHMIEDLINSSNLSNSAMATYRLLNKKYTISQIANRRKLKYNTIYDHIVEIAFNDNEFPVTSYVSENKQHSILHAIQHTPSYKLKEIKDRLGNDFSYFEIRLVLASYRNLLK